MTVSQAAKVLNVNPSTVRRWVQSGRVPAQKWGSVYYIEPAALNIIPAHRSGRECAAAAVAALDGLLDAGCMIAEHPMGKSRHGFAFDCNTNLPA